jgi:hypothetical protein
LGGKATKTTATTTATTTTATALGWLSIARRDRCDHPIKSASFARSLNASDAAS